MDGSDNYLTLSVDEVAALRPLAEMIIRATGGWSATPEDAEEREVTFTALRAATRMVRAELDRVNDELRAAGIEYPLGARGVHDLAVLFRSATEERDDDD